MMDLELTITIIIAAYLSGIITTKVVDLLKETAMKRGDDDFMKETKKIVNDLQTTLSDLKIKIRAAETKYLDARHELGEVQMKYDILLEKFEGMRKMK